MAEVQQHIVRCDNGHYYDAGRYSECPHCKSGGFAVTAPPDLSGSSSGGSPAVGSFPPTEAPNGYAAPVNNGGGNFPPTTDPYGNANGGGFGPTTPPINRQYNPGMGITEPPVVIQDRNKKVGDFSDTEFVDPRTPKGMPTPVVGWIVAIDGPVRGTDYRIHVGYNSIGREVGDIVIHGDQSISAQRDASIAYEPRTRGFYITHDEGRNIPMVNNTPLVGGQRQLEPYDVVIIGNTKLIFVPLCSESFDWGDNGSR